MIQYIDFKWMVYGLNLMFAEDLKLEDLNTKFKVSM
jgi:hypothetical protein